MAVRGYTSFCPRPRGTPPCSSKCPILVRLSPRGPGLPSGLLVACWWLVGGYPVSTPLPPFCVHFLDTPASSPRFTSRSQLVVGVPFGKLSSPAVRWGQERTGPVDPIALALRRRRRRSRRLGRGDRRCRRRCGGQGCRRAGGVGERLAGDREWGCSRRRGRCLCRWA